MLAIYDSTNCMVGMTSVSTPLSSGENEIQFKDVSFGGIQVGNYTLKCFVWDSQSGISPLSQSADKELLVN